MTEDERYPDELIEKPPVAVLEPPDAEPLRFDSWEDLEKWAEEEAERWAWIEDHYEQVPIVGPIAYDGQRWKLLNLKIAAHFYRTHEGAEEKVSPHMSDFSSALNSIKDGETILSYTPTGQIALAAKDDRPDLAMAHIAWFSELPSEEDHHHEIGSALKLMLEARIDQCVSDEKIQAEETALKQMRTEWARKLEHEHGNVANLIKTAQENFQKTLTQQTANQRKAADVTEHAQQQIGEALSNAQARLVALENRFHARLTLEGPHKFWETKADEHHTSYKRSLIAISGVTAAVVAGTAWGLPPYTTTLSAAGLTGPTLAIALAVPAIAAIWLLRTIGQIFTTNMALRDDARLRKTMIATFLSLLDDPDSQIKPEDRILVLEAIFRRPEGAKASEGPTFSAMEAFVKQAQKAPKADS